MAKNSKKTAHSNSALSRNISVFVEGVTFTRSFSHPYLAEQIDPLWVLRDAPRHRANEYRDEEWCAYKTPAAVVDKLVRAHTRGVYAICAFHPIDTTDEALRAEYKAQGYKLDGAESVMVHALKQIPSIKSPARIQRVLTTDQADAENGKAQGQTLEIVLPTTPATASSFAVNPANSEVGTCWAASQIAFSGSL